MKAITELVAQIENPTTSETERTKAMSELNLLGKTNEEIEDSAYSYWHQYFSENIEKILSEKLVIVSHLLADKEVNSCFDAVFQEFNQKRKQMGVDSIQKFGYTGF